MPIFPSSPLDSLHALFHRQLRRLYDGESRSMEESPRVIEACASTLLRDACEGQLALALQQARRLESVFDALSLKARRETSAIMKHLLAEARDLAMGSGVASVRDAALIATLETIGHVRIASYGTARTWALHLGFGDVAHLLQINLDEELAAERMLTHLADSGIDAVAAFASPAPPVGNVRGRDA